MTKLMNNENAFFTIFKSALPKKTELENCNVYHIKSFKYTDANMDLYEKYKFEKDFYKILTDLKYDSQTNNVAIYYVINANGEGMVYLLSDPIELLENEYVIEKYEWIFDEKIMGLSTVKRIH